MYQYVTYEKDLQKNIEVNFSTTFKHVIGFHLYSY